MKGLAEQTESSWYRFWERDRITRRTVDRHFGRAYHQAVERAPVIRFSLDEIDDVAFAVKAGRAGFRPRDLLRGEPGNMTNAELEYLSRNPDLLKKTIFYRTNPKTGVAEPVPSPF
jgi:hypothetical protein